jgi:hypothetical protein
MGAAGAKGMGSSIDLAILSDLSQVILELPARLDLTELSETPDSLAPQDLLEMLDPTEPMETQVPLGPLEPREPPVCAFSC